MSHHLTPALRRGITQLALAAMITLLPLSAHAALIAVAQEGKQRLELHDQAGHCLGAARLAIFTDGTQRIPGCWVVRPEVVTIAFLDGDHLALPLTVFRKPQEL